MMLGLFIDFDYEHIVAVYKRLKGGVFYVEYTVPTPIKGNTYLKVAQAAAMASQRELSHSSVCVELTPEQVTLLFRFLHLHIARCCCRKAF